MGWFDNETYGEFIQGTDENDTINNNALKVTVDAGAGNDEINTFGNVLLEDYRDVVKYYRLPSYSSINGGSGNDKISNQSNDSTVLGGAGNDTIENWSGGGVKG